MSKKWLIFILGLSDTSSNNSLARLADSLGAPSNPSGVHPIITNIPLETPPLPSRNVGQPPPLRPPVITSPSRQNSRYVNIIMSVRLWNFKDGGPKMQDFCPRIDMLKENCFKTFLWWLIVRQKSAKIVLSKSIFYIKNWRIFFEKKSFKHIQFRRPFFEKNIFF